MKNTCAVIAATLCALAAPEIAIAEAGVDPQRLDRAMDNYRALREGSKQIGQLTREELVDVSELDRLIRNEKRDTRSLSQRCVDDEMRVARGSVSRLERRIIDMKCRETGD